MKRLGDDILTPIEFLTKKQRKQIVITWIAINDHLNFTQHLFVDLFRQCPLMRNFFHFSNVSLEDLLENVNFQRHCVAYANFLDYIVGFVHLNSGNFIEDAGIRLGNCHAERIHRIDHVSDEWWDIFIQINLHHLQPYFHGKQIPILNRFLIRSTQRAWRILFIKLTEFMKVGFQEYKKKKSELEKEDPVPGLPPSPNRASDLIKWLEMSSEITKMRIKETRDSKRDCLEETEWSEEGPAEGNEKNELRRAGASSTLDAPQPNLGQETMDNRKVHLGSLEDWVL